MPGVLAGTCATGATKRGPSAELASDDTKDPAGSAQHVRLAACVESKAAERVDCGQVEAGRRSAAVGANAEGLARAEIAVEVGAGKAGDARRANDLAAGHRATAPRLGVVDDRQHVALGCGAASKRLVAFEGVPAEVGAVAASVARSQNSDFLKAVLANITDPQIPVCRIEAEAPCVADAPHEDLGSGSGYEGVVGRDVVSGVRVDVDAKDRPVQRVRVLAVLKGVAASPAVAHADVEEPVGPKGEVPTVVVAAGLFDLKEHFGRAKVGGISVHGVANDVRVARGVGEVDVEPVAASVEDQSKKALFVTPT